MTTEDRRVRRTRRALAQALVALASAHPYESITIRDITEQADIGYATFFRHYASKDDLMLDVFQDITDGLESLAGTHAGEFFQTEGRLIFEHVRQHEALYRSILDSLVFTRKLKGVLAEHIRKQLARHRQPRTRDKLLGEIAVHHMMTAVVGLIEWWLAHGLQPDAEQMAQIYERLIVQGTWQALFETTPPGGSVAGFARRLSNPTRPCSSLRRSRP